MAYVGITDRLVNEVKNKIDEMEEQELRQSIKDYPHRRVSATNPLVLKALWGEHVELGSKIPRPWKDTCSYITFKFPDIEVKVYPLVGQEFVGPANVTRYEMQFKISTTDDAEILEMKERTVQVRAIMNKWNSVEEQVKKFLRAAKSLNEALKLWPQLALYIPQKHLDTVALKNAKKKTGSAAADLLSEMEVDQLTAHAVAARMTK